MVALATLFECVAERAREFNVIHCHATRIKKPRGYWVFLLVTRPWVTTGVTILKARL
jgi:hypothetical protein